MRIALLHNRYRVPGGEDAVFEEESTVLTEYGHRVTSYVPSNAAIDERTVMGKVRVASGTVWNHSVYKEIRQWFRKDRPDVAHFHNFLPIISPAGYYAAKAEGIPVVQTLHNFRLICPGALLARDGEVCESCLGLTIPWHAVRHNCYRSSKSASAVVATMLSIHNLLGTWTKQVDLFLTPSEFARQKFIKAGFPAERVRVKPNFVEHDRGYVPDKLRYFLFAGRLSGEKGVLTLLRAWKDLHVKVPLRIVGQGPLVEEVIRTAAESPYVEYLGYRSRTEVADLMAEATAVLVPSECYETFGKVVVESFARGTPVIATAIGPLPDLVHEGETGLLFSPGDATDLLRKIEWAVAHPDHMRRMGRGAREAYENGFTAALNVEELVRSYEWAMEHSIPLRGGGPS